MPTALTGTGPFQFLEVVKMLKFFFVYIAPFHRFFIVSNVLYNNIQEHTGGATPSQIKSLGSIQEEPPSQINSLESIQEEPPPLRSSPWGAYRWSHPLSDQFPGENTEGTRLTQINYIWSIQDKGCLILVSQLK